MCVVVVWFVCGVLYCGCVGALSLLWCLGCVGVCVV